MTGACTIWPGRSLRACRRLGVLALAALALCAAAPAQAQEAAPQAAAVPAEPSGYRFEPYRAPTPATLAGAEVLTPAQAEALWRGKAAVFLDVLPRPPRPANLPEGTVWHEQPHESIPGALWLPNVGFGALDAGTDHYFQDGLAAATNGNHQARVVIFCLKDCWMSWNAAKRAVAAGYTQVAWFPTGIDGWKAAGLPLERLAPWQANAAR
ncbi:PQQ-dependent catabolism-associated CXXCW motif protein [Xanthobacter sediminis]